jgi:hypothetical protein
MAKISQSPTSLKLQWLAHSAWKGNEETWAAKMKGRINLLLKTHGEEMPEIRLANVSLEIKDL